VSIQINIIIVTGCMYREKFIGEKNAVVPFLQLSVVIVTLPPRNDPKCVGRGGK